MQQATARLRVAVIGGLTRATDQWERTGDKFGVDLEHHDGRADGRRSDTIASMVRRADITIIITALSSHNGVAIARKTAHALHKPHLLVKRMRPDGLPDVLREALALKAAA
ncbi:MAG TPA: DUF2325 domain-containing protein [Kofleriaceae bacterium]|jgi:hypothetical protein